jgi:uncharacterized protein with GYD domain
MPSYISLMKFTEQGIKGVKDIPRRIEENRANMTKLGIELKSWHLTMGRYDVVTHIEAPSDEVVVKFALLLAGQGNARTETLRAFPIEEFKKIVASLP